MPQGNRAVMPLGSVYSAASRVTLKPESSRYTPSVWGTGTNRAAVAASKSSPAAAAMAGAILQLSVA